MTLRSPPGALDHDHQKLLQLQATSPTTTGTGSSSSSRDHHRHISIVDDMPMPIPMPKLLRTNSSKKVPAASNLERALLSFKSWDWEPIPIHDKGIPPPSPSINGARPGRLALHSPTNGVPIPPMADDADTTADDTKAAAAATRVQKMFKGHRTRRTLADCAIVIEELWWKLYDSASLDRTSISFFAATGRHETPASRWLRAGKRIAKVGKGLAKDDKAQKLALRHWLEAIDPRHRYGHNLHLYYDIWFGSSSAEPFFYWLDIGGGREIHHPSCPRSKLSSQLVTYLGTSERAAYQVVVDGGRLTYLQSRQAVTTTDGSKWIFVLSTARALYVAQKRKGQFQHSSFLAGGAASAAGRLVAKDGVLKAVWPYSGHYLPTEDNFNQFIAFLQDNHVDLTHVKRCSVDDDDFPLSLKRKQQSIVTDADDDEHPEEAKEQERTTGADTMDDGINETAAGSRGAAPAKWTSGAGARIGCVRDYPAELQSRALEQVNLSPSNNRPPQSPWAGKGKAPISPRVQYMGAVSPAAVRPPPLKQQCLGIRPPTVHLTLPSSKNANKHATTNH